MSISVDALKKYYDNQMGIESVSLQVKAGEFYGFIGPNGAGKSTTLKVLMTLLFPTGGYAKIFDLDVTKSEMRIKPHIGYLPSEINLYSDVTVKALFDMNIQYYADLKMKDKNTIRSSGPSSSSKARKEALESEMWRLTQYLNVDVSKKFKTLSFGNQKKVGYILSVLHDPQVILLDEPTNGLDPLIKDRIFEDLKARNQRGVTVFFSSHNLDEVERHCTKVAFIKDGKIIKISTIESLKAFSLKNVTCRLAIEEAEAAFHLLSEFYKVEQRQAVNHTVTLYFQLTKDLSKALAMLSNFEVIDINIESPSLEEIFKYYY